MSGSARVVRVRVALALVWLTTVLLVACSATAATAAEPALITSDPAHDLAHLPFDYIVVGAGLAGMVVATRLSEDSDKRVLLIEAGNDTRSDPLVRTVRLDNAALHVRLQSRPQVGGRSVLHTFGIGLGGSTTINGAKVDGPPSTQIDALRQFGNPSWSWLDTLHYMKKSQNYHAPGDIARQYGATYDASGHGSHGPLDITFSPQSYTGAPQQTFVSALNDTMGIDKIVDAGAGEAVGYSFCPHFIKHGTNVTRESSATAYFTPIEYERSNLFVLTGWRGVRINWQDEDEDESGEKGDSIYENLAPAAQSSSSLLATLTTPFQRPFFGGSGSASSAGRRGRRRSDDSLRAKSVTVQSRPYGPTVDLSLRTAPSSEVVVSTGALITPLLLELSGIGDANVLASIGVERRIHLPGVGRNLVDKPTNTLSATTRGSHREGVTGDPLPAVAMLTIDKVVRNVTETERYLRSNVHRWARDAVKTGGAATVQGAVRQYEVMLHGIFKQQWPVAEWEYFSRNMIAIKTFVLQPWSRGFIHSTSNMSVWNVDGHDVDLHGQIWTRGADMDMQVASLRAARRLMNGEQMRALWHDETEPGVAAFQEEELQDQHSDDEATSSDRVIKSQLPSSIRATTEREYGTWRAYILRTYDLICHNAGTAAMMARELGGVVDERFKVYGTQNVRVVDASIFPMQLSAHPSLTIFGVAEKAADVIRAAARL